ncbi:MAG: tetratricopeptide repeat protein [Paludibaculum sp.]
MYSYLKDYEKAAEMFNRVVRAENNSIRAMNYLNRMNTPAENPTRKQKGRKPAEDGAPQAASADVLGRLIGSLGPGDADKKQPDRKQPEKIQPERTPYSRSRLSGLNGSPQKSTGSMIITGVVCFVLGLLIAFLIRSGKIENTELLSGYRAEADAKVTAAEQSLKESESRYNELSKENEEVKKNLAAALEEVEHYKAVTRLSEVESLAAAKKYEEAADMLLLMKTTSFQEEELARFETLKEKILSSAAWTVYEDGYKLYNNKKYDEALKKLGKVPVYNSSFERMDAVYYYLGRCSQQLNDSRNALAYYQKLLDTYPKSSYADNAKAKIRQISSQP